MCLRQLCVLYVYILCHSRAIGEKCIWPHKLVHGAYDLFCMLLTDWGVKKPK